MPVKILFTENHPVVQQAVNASNQLLNNPVFYDRISQKDKFDLSTATPPVLAEILLSSSLDFTVQFFYPNIFNFKYRKTLAYTDGRFPNHLFLNHKKLNRSAADIAATIIHESVHAVDDVDEQYTFGHGNNSPVGKKNTAPYWIGNLAYQLISGEHDTAVVFDQEEDTA